MKTDKIIDRESKVSLYVQIYSIFKEKITTGEWPTGTQIPIVSVLKHMTAKIIYFILIFKDNLLESGSIAVLESVDEAQIICFIRIYHLFGPVCISISKYDH